MYSRPVKIEQAEAHSERLLDPKIPNIILVRERSQCRLFHSGNK